MHRAYLSESCCTCVWLGGRLELGGVLGALVPAVGLEVVVATLATDGDFEPPQPASAAAATTAPSTANPRHVARLRPGAALLERSVLSSISSLSRSKLSRPVVGDGW